MFEYSSGKSEFGHSPWLYLLFGVAVVYAILTLFPETERFAALIGAALAAVVLGIIRRALRGWLSG